VYRSPIRRTRRGEYRVSLSDQERAVLRALPDQLRQLIKNEDPGLVRLFPPAYVNDLEYDREYQRLMREELVGRRLESLAVVEETVDAERLTEEQLTAWLKVINDLRLVIGTTLDVSEDHELTPEEFAEDDPRHGLVIQYWFLQYLLHAAVDALDHG
jgi:hypothetical protein